MVSATRNRERRFDVPVSVDRVDGRAIRDGQLGVNLSESLAAVPGVSIENRQNYAQDLQISIRGFGARSSFGVRGVRLYADGIPATMPDGQGQFSHFDLGSADRIEVVRGPFSALYGNSSGGVISIFTADPVVGIAGTASASVGSLGTQRLALLVSGGDSSSGFVADAAHFETSGYRDHSRAERNTANAKLRLAWGENTTLTLIGNAIETPEVQDPLGLTRSQAAANPEQAGTNALLYNTRKQLEQEQAGATLATTLSATDEVTATVYAGRRLTTQFQAILRTVEANPLHPGGVIDLGREYHGADVHLADRRQIGDHPFVLTLGATYEGLDEIRHGFLNYDGTQLGVIGALRRDERNRVGGVDEYAQAEYDPGARWHLIAGLRHSDIDVSSRDKTGVSPPTNIRYTATNPVAGVTLRMTPYLNAYGSYGRGFETPTLNDLAYRSTDGSLPGLNTALRPATSDNYEAGLKLAASRLTVNAAAFYISTRHELAVQQNAGGRQVFENIDQTERRGAEVALDGRLSAGLEVHVAYTYMRAVTAAPYTSCTGIPCVPVVVPAGNRLPAVPANALYAGLSWRAPRLGFVAAAETVGRAKIYVDDRNSDAAGAFWTTSARAGFTQAGSSWTVSETLRIDNVFGRRYVDSVIVNESNGRFFEPDPGRVAYLLLTASYR
ncbi:MAG: TonB-dependent receptor [Proteobacteria bacterium]|nr:TonB-dependent receptor [Pseudomonadota bacterium]